MKVLITGGSGLLGKYLLQTAPEEAQVSLTYKKIHPPNTEGAIWYRLNVTNRADVFDLFDLVKPNLVIHCASIGSVDYTEDHYSEVRDVNVGGLGHVIDAANGYKSKLIYISTNAVFSGENPPYNEESPLQPVNAYGIIKKEAERNVRTESHNWVIVRPFMLYGWPYPGGRTNWAVTIVKNAGIKACKLVHDHIWMPTYAGDAANTIWHFAERQNEIYNEIYNVACPERATLYEFGLKVCEVFDLPFELVKPVQSGYFPSIAKRPKDTTYDLVKLSEQGIMLSDIKTGLEKMKAEK